MSLSKSIRLTRFQVRSGHDVMLKVESKSGRVYTLQVVDCSITGVAASTSASQELFEDLKEDEIISASKLVFDGSEYVLGRLVIKRAPAAAPIEEMVTEATFGFATIDSKVPIDGPLSRHLNINFDDGGSAYRYELRSNHFSIASFVGVDFNNVDILERTKKFGFFYQDWQRSEKFGYFMARENSQGARIQLTRKRQSGRSDYVMLGSNDYLGLASHPKVREAAIEAIRNYGFGSTGSLHTSGYSVLHDQLCKKLASLYRKDDCVVFASGYAANVGIVSGLCREQDLVVADVLSHASIHDGITMSRATCRLFKHNDMKHLEKILEENRAQYGGCLIATEGAFSMDGALGQIDQIYTLSRKYNARIMVDQAHCMGVVGKNGLGAVEKFNLISETDLIMGTFSKALGGVGGFVVGSSDLCNWIRSFSRGFIFATSFPPCNAAATIAALDLMTSEGLVEKLQANIKHFISGLRYLGASINPAHETAVIPLEIRDEEKMGQMYQSLLDSGVFVIPVVYPVVSRNRCRFRFSLRADLTVSDLDFALSALEKAMTVAGFRFEEMEQTNSELSKSNSKSSSEKGVA